MRSLAKKEKGTLNTCPESNKHKKEVKRTYLCLFILPERSALSVCSVIISKKKNIKLCSLSKKNKNRRNRRTYLSSSFRTVRSTLSVRSSSIPKKKEKGT